MGNSASASELTSLKSKVKALETKTSDYATIKTQVADASSNAAKSIDYETLAKKITDVSSYNDKVAAALAKNSGALGEGLAAKMGKDDNVTTRIVTGLQDNTSFAKTVSDKLTDEAGGFRDRLRGDKGAPGELASSKEAVKKALYDTKYTMWCADGDICQVPATNKGIEAPTLTVQRINIGGWNIREDGTHLVFRRGEAGDGDNQPHLRMANDGNFWVSRSTSRGWVADMIGDKQNQLNNKINVNDTIWLKNQKQGNYLGWADWGQNGGCLNISGWKCDIPKIGGGRGDWEKFNIER